jgi:hypothetical protein
MHKFLNIYLIDIEEKYYYTNISSNIELLFINCYDSRKRLSGSY